MTRKNDRGMGPSGAGSRLERWTAILRLADLRLSTARGVALFFGLFSLANAAATVLGSAASQDVWWIDLHALPRGLAAALALAFAVLLAAWGIAPRPSALRRRATAAVAALMALAALANALGFYGALRTGDVNALVPVPSSALVAAALAWVAWVILGSVEDTGTRRAGDVATVAALLLLAALFPVAQTAFFGTTDYRRSADAAVIFGAKVYASGTLSQSLEDRVQTGVGLYRSGLVPVLVMSGGVGSSGVDEATAMRNRAVALGVPTDAILMDQHGDDTDATVRNTTVLFERAGIHRVLAVSQFYHLPRIKLAYRAVGVDVQTVPATGPRYIVETPLLVLREIGGFWTYWFRSQARALGD